MNLTSIDSIKNFINQNVMCVVYFSSSSCSVCHALLPKIKEVLLDYPNIKFAQVEITDIPQSSGEYSIFTFPTILIFIDKKK